MNEAIVFDTHRFVRNLTASDFTERQAEALADEQVQLLDANLATKADLAAVKADLAAVKADLDVRITNVQAALEANLATVKADLEVKIANVQSNLLKWVFAALIAQGGVIVTIVTLL